ncbi:MAG: response regulator transcription factor [Ktedonobacterales bacterium]|nr:response regulator transcription factor [Ktedonobacterales bacterium]
MAASGEAEALQRVILVVEDDADIREALVYNLRQEGYVVLAATDGAAAVELARQQVPALVLLDLMLPRMDGLEVCRRLRAQPRTAGVPILMLTARAEETDKIVGLEMGADDYVTKPFSWAEVRARVRALLRRGGGGAADADAPQRAVVLEAGDLRVDEDRREVSRRGEPVELPARLFDLLAYMLRNRGLVLTRDRLLERVWGSDYAGDPRTVDVYVRWLREKIEDDPASPQFILTVRGVGYRFKG